MTISQLAIITNLTIIKSKRKRAKKLIKIYSIFLSINHQYQYQSYYD